MALGDTFDLGRVLAQAQQIKSMRREEGDDNIRRQYLQAQIANTQQSGQFAQQDQQAQVSSREATQRYLEAQAIEASDDPVTAAQQYAPELVQNFDKTQGPGAFAKLQPDQIKKIAAHAKQKAAALAGIDINKPAAADAGFSLNPGEVRFDAKGNQVASVAAKPDRPAGEGAGFELSPGQTRYDARGNVIASLAADNSKEARADNRATQSLRKEFESHEEVKNYKKQLPILLSARNAPDTRAGDLDIIYAVGKTLDPGSVVRGEELKLSQDVAPWLENLVTQAQSQVKKTGRLSPETRKDINKMLNDRVYQSRLAYDQEYQRYADVAAKSGFTPIDVVGKHAANAYQRRANDKKTPDAGQTGGLKVGQATVINGFTVTRSK